MQMATGYSVFANGGYLVQPQLIRQVTDHRGRVLYKAPSVNLADQPRAIDERNAFVMNSLLADVTRTGTAARASVALGRSDTMGKTGTTSDAVDAWFAGYHPSLAAVAWVGHSTPKSLGERESGGRLALPIWMEYMQRALQGVPESPRRPPPTDADPCAISSSSTTRRNGRSRKKASKWSRPAST
jgi:penicillin-binding protein 1A